MQHIPAHAVGLPCKDHIKLPQTGIFHHPLEIRAAVRFAADGAVSIYFNDGHALAGGQFPALLHLLLNGAIALVGTGIPGIDDGTGCGISVDSLFHAVTLLSILQAKQLLLLCLKFFL